MKKLVTLMVVAIAACCFFTSCDKEDGGGIKKSDILGTWYEGSRSMYYRYEFKKNGTFDCYYTYSYGGYYDSYVDGMSGKYEIYPKDRLFVVQDNDGASSTYDILILNETTFSYREKYSDKTYTNTLRRSL